jgi:hypothetical protein
MKNFCQTCHRTIDSCCYESAREDGPQIDEVAERRFSALESANAKLRSDLADAIRERDANAESVFAHRDIEARLIQESDGLIRNVDAFGMYRETASKTNWGRVSALYKDWTAKRAKWAKKEST